MRYGPATNATRSAFNPQDITHWSEKVADYEVASNTWCGAKIKCGQLRNVVGWYTLKEGKPDADVLDAKDIKQSGIVSIPELCEKLGGTMTRCTSSLCAQLHEQKGCVAPSKKKKEEKTILYAQLKNMWFVYGDDDDGDEKLDIKEIHHWGMKVQRGQAKRLLHCEASE